MDRKGFEGEITSDLLEESEQLIIDFEKLRKITKVESAVVPVVVQDVAPRKFY